MDDQVGLLLRKRLSGWVHKRVNNPADAEDLLQDILLKVISNSAPVDSDKLLNWVFAIARNRIIDYYRVRGRDHHQVLLEETHVTSAEEPDAPGVKAALRGVLSELMGELSTQDRQVLIAVDLEGMSQKAYALSLGIDYSTAKSRVQRARKRLRHVLEHCCRIELDRRGKPILCEPRRGSDCCKQ